MTGSVEILVLSYDYTLSQVNDEVCFFHFLAVTVLLGVSRGSFSALGVDKTPLIIRGDCYLI